MIFEAAAHERYAIGQQCRGERVALKATHGLAIE